MSYQLKLLLSIVIGTAALAACDRIEDVDIDGSVLPFTDLDMNGDGLLTRDETRAVPELAEIFDAADTDQDNMLSVPEYSHATLEGVTVSAVAAAGYQFELLDIDENLQLSMEEAEELPDLAAEFSTFDTDQSGTLDSMEFDRALRQGFDGNQ